MVDSLVYCQHSDLHKDTSCVIHNEYRIITPDRRQSKTVLTIDDHGSKLARNSVFDCYLSPVGRQMAIENSVSNDF